MATTSSLPVTLSEDDIIARLKRIVGEGAGTGNVQMVKNYSTPSFTSPTALEQQAANLPPPREGSVRTESYGSAISSDDCLPYPTTNVPSSHSPAPILARLFRNHMGDDSNNSDSLDEHAGAKLSPRKGRGRQKKSVSPKRQTHAHTPSPPPLTSTSDESSSSLSETKRKKHLSPHRQTRYYSPKPSRDSTSDESNISSHPVASTRKKHISPHNRQNRNRSPHRNLSPKPPEHHNSRSRQNQPYKSLSPTRNYGHHSSSKSPTRGNNNTPRNKKTPKKNKAKSLSPVPSPQRRHHRPKQTIPTEPAEMTIIVRRVDLLDGAAAAAAAADNHNVSTEDDYYDGNPNQRPRSPCQSPVHFDLNARSAEGEPRSPSPLSSSNSSSCAESSPFTEGLLSPMPSPTPMSPKSRTTTPPVSPYAFKDPNQMTPSHVRNLIYTASYIHTQPVDISVITHRGFGESHKNNKTTTANSVAVVRCKTKNKNKKYISSKYISSECDIPNPYPFVHDKYWAQRHRLFKKFDEGIMLDPEGWYSVTPEVIADHVAKTVGEMSATMSKLSHPYEGIVVLDAFCGCGGNAIAFGKLPIHQVSLVVCIDLDRNKLRMAAHNAYLYNIPTDKVVFIEANTCFVMDQCYHDGDLFYNGTPWDCYMSPREQYAGYTIGGLDLLPFHIDLVFMDPPWGGVDYNDLGKNGYDLAKNMKIQYHNPFYPEDIHDGVVDGFSLVKMAASATKSKIVIYDTPRNVNKTSLGQAALNAGYRGNVKLEEHYLNGRLKTVTSYFGRDFGELLRQNLT